MQPLWFIIVLSATIIVIFAYNANNVINNIIARSQLAACIEAEGYVERWNDTDTRIRNEYYNNNDPIMTAQQLVDAYIASVRVPTRSERKHLEQLVSEIKMNHLFILSNKQEAIKQMKWKFLLFDDTRFEGGMPHTHVPFIMLPMNNLKSISSTTLLHEQIHVFQRYHPSTALDAFELHKYAITGFVYPQDNHRANPDTSRILFDDIRPTWTTDATQLTHIHDGRDHPFEIMAYSLQLQ